MLYAIATSLALIALKLGTKDAAIASFSNGRANVNINFYTVSGVFLYGLSFLLYTYLISKNDLGYIIPLVTALVYIIIFVASYFIFHEVFTVFKVIGIILIMAGLVMLNVGK